VRGRRWWPTVFFLAFAGTCSCDTTSVDDGCFAAPVAHVTLEFPREMLSISSVEASGACKPPLAGCAEPDVACDAGPCGCALDLEVVAASGSSPTVVCHIEVRSTRGQVLVRDLSFTVEQGGVCPALTPSIETVTVDFSDAADAGAWDGDASG
jgi:hypothetical protein